MATLVERVRALQGGLPLDAEALAARKADIASGAAVTADNLADRLTQVGIPHASSTHVNPFERPHRSLLVQALLTGQVNQSAATVNLQHAVSGFAGAALHTLPATPLHLAPAVFDAPRSAVLWRSCR